MKVLCICEHGNVRSVALAYLIKTIYGHEAIAVGHKNVSKDTMDMLMMWADKSIDVTKLVGEDIWYDPFNRNLQHKLLKKLKSLKL